MNFSYVDIVGDECKGWLNLFFGEFPVALVSNVEIANEIRKVTPEKTNNTVEPTAIECDFCQHELAFIMCIKCYEMME